MNMETPITSGLLAEWYPKGLYIISDPEVKVEKKTRTDKRKYLVISSEEPDRQHYDLLVGIMGACKINMNEVHVVNFSNEKDYKVMLEQYGAIFILMFGIEPMQLDLPIVFPHFQLQQFSNASWVSSPDLSVIQNDKLMKTKLWLCLKQAFSL